MHLITADCCSPFIDQLGQPSKFVMERFGGPATSLTEFAKQRNTLKQELAGTCAHYRDTAIMQHTYLLNDDHDNRVYNYELLLANFAGVTAEEMDELSNRSLS